MSVVENAKPAADGAPSSPGKRLADARTAQNLSQADVARQLKLSVWQVEALESGRYPQLPGPIFVRGFIRNYARLVKLDPDDLVLALGDSVPQAARRPEPSPSRDIPFPGGGRPRWVALAVPVAVLVALLAIYEFLWNEPESPVPAPTASAPKGTAAGPRPAGTTTAPKSAAPTTNDTKAGAASVATAPAAEPAREAPVVAAPAPEAGRPARRGAKEVKLAFDQECWVEIRDRNEKVIFSQLNRPGTQQSVTGMPPFSVVVGNAHGARLTYEDKPVDLAPHTKIDVARLILQ
jgi:cytoskeleton protein RodZ